MAIRLEVYKCDLCGNIIEVLHGGEGQLVCCGQPMKQMIENTVDAAKEKHVPVMEQVGGGIKVKVGSVPHPMIEAHFIEFIELIGEDKICRKWLKPGVEPEALFNGMMGEVFAREYCNLHGLWKG
jgi:superoxide reductase